jgi:hypothetical protein
LYPSGTWVNVGLPFLGEIGVPFPSEKLVASFIFPKIAKSNRLEHEAIHFMNYAHGESDNDMEPVKAVFPTNMIANFYSLMKIGQYYQPLPLSGSADSLIRCSKTTVVCFQFKNFQDPFTFKMLGDEVMKCKCDDNEWKIYLILVCMAGHNVTSDGCDHSLVHEGVNVVLLSTASVQQFLGDRTCIAFSSSSMCADNRSRLQFSPMKPPVDDVDTMDNSFNALAFK